MKTTRLLVGIVTLSLLTNVIYAQSTCKVLIPKIGDTYTGSCKNGLADGLGEAFGIDHYKGDFKKGFPDGSGTYIWQTGEKYEGEWKKGIREGKGEYTFKHMGRDSVITGIWKEDKYIGKKAMSPYVIEYRNSIGRISCIKIGTNRNYVNYKFSRGGIPESNINGLNMQGSSGTEHLTSSFIGFEEVTFPFKGNVKFIAPNALNTATLNCELRLTINEPGAWEVTIFY